MKIIKNWLFRRRYEWHLDKVERLAKMRPEKYELIERHYATMEHMTSRSKK